MCIEAFSDGASIGMQQKTCNALHRWTNDAYTKEVCCKEERLLIICIVAAEG